MRWMWIDRIVELERATRLVAIKHVSMAEEHIHDHFAPTPSRDALPVMPMSLIVEGMAQSAGILVGHAHDFAEKVILAKVAKAELSREATPGCTLRYTATIQSLNETGASTKGLVELLEPSAGYPDQSPAQPEAIGEIDLMFSHLDRNLSGAEYPEENFVFSESFRTLLRSSGIDTAYPIP